MAPPTHGSMNLVVPMHHGGEATPSPVQAPPPAEDPANEQQADHELRRFAGDLFPFQLSDDDLGMNLDDILSDI